jgi:hypothetical protein
MWNIVHSDSALEANSHTANSAARLAGNGLPQRTSSRVEYCGRNGGTHRSYNFLAIDIDLDKFRHLHAPLPAAMEDKVRMESQAFVSEFDLQAISRWQAKS